MVFGEDLATAKRDASLLPEYNAKTLSDADFNKALIHTMCFWEHAASRESLEITFGRMDVKFKRKRMKDRVYYFKCAFFIAGSAGSAQLYYLHISTDIQIQNNPTQQPQGKLESLLSYLDRSLVKDLMMFGTGFVTAWVLFKFWG